MEKEIVSCTPLNHMSAATAERVFRVLMDGLADRYGLEADGKVRERRSGETGFGVDSRKESVQHLVNE